MSDFANWLSSLVKDTLAYVFGWIWDFIVDLARWVLDGVLYLIGLIPLPDFLSTYSMGSMFASLPSDILYFVTVFRVPECIAIIGAGVGFRLLRKVFTLGQW